MFFVEIAYTDGSCLIISLKVGPRMVEPGAVDVCKATELQRAASAIVVAVLASKWNSNLYDCAVSLSTTVA